MFWTENSSDTTSNESEEISETITPEQTDEENTEGLPALIDFQAVVDEWANSVKGNKSVLIYDLDRDEIVGSYDPDENYNTASLYKLFVVYEGYRKVQSGEWNYDSTVAKAGYSVGDCLDLAIRESHSPCAESLWGMLGHDYLDQVIIDDFGIINSHISSLISNASDIMQMMQIYYLHTDITDEGLIATMKDSFLNQPATNYNWRQGLPSGFTSADVYNKVGWEYNSNGKYWNIYHDAAIVSFPEEERDFIVVVMTNKVSYQDIARLGREIENTYYQYVLKN